jgi:hypothetical protein
MNRNLARYLGLMASTTAAVTALSACGGGDDGAPASATVTKGTLAIGLMNDAPACGFEAVNVTISKLRFHMDYNAAADASGWTELAFSPAKKINLLHPASVTSGAAVDLGELALPTGIYTQMVVVFDPNTSAAANTVKLAGASTEAPLETAPALAGGIRVPVDLNVQDGQKLNLVFDIDACASVQSRGTTYVLKPRPRMVPAVLNGISGFVDKAVLANSPVITAQQNGGIVATTVPNPGTGEFVLPRLRAGKYDVVVRADGKATGVIGAVPVEASAVTSVATAAAPIPLATSAVSSITGQVTYTAPAAAPDGGTWIMASQTIPANTAVGNAETIVTYRLQPVDLGTGAYTLANLPRSAIQYALYKTSLPLTPAAATTSLGTGRYRVEAVATGYSNKTTTASANVNVGSANATGINIALP